MDTLIIFLVVAVFTYTMIISVIWTVSMIVSNRKRMS